MRIFSETKDMLKKVYRYEKEIVIDNRALQIILMILVIILLLLNSRNFMLGKYAVSVLVLLAAVAGGLAAVLLGRYKESAGKVFVPAVIFCLILSVPIILMGVNDGFALLWYMMLPILTLILLGIPYGAPLCISFGVVVTALFWTPLRMWLMYGYEEEYLLYYPAFYWFFCLMVVVMDIFYKRYQMKQSENERNLEEQVKNAVLMQQNLMLDSVTTISRMLDEKDSYTKEHSERVAEYSVLIAQNLEGASFTEHEISLLYRSALLHDIGKIAIPDAVLNKPERLTKEEYEIMKTHTVWGRRILSGLEFLPQADLGAEYHHERFDGKGYPNGIGGAEIPLMARIISAADALDAMNSNRCYRRQCGDEYIVSEFRKGAGVQFDSRIADTVVKLIGEGRIVI